jgi:branched-chain amino acid transport system substrate-binding protein
MKRAGCALGFLLAMVLLPTGCGVRFPGSTGPLLKIGLVAPFEGRLRARGYEVLYAVRLAVGEWNEAGGVGGYQVELVALDDGGDPAVAVQQVRELAVDAAVVGVVGHFSEATTLAAAPEYAAQGLALVAPGVGAEGVTAAGGVVRLGPSDRLLGWEAAGYAIEVLAARRPAVLRGQDGLQGLADAFVVAAGQLGSAVVLDESVAEEGWVSRLAEVAPDLIFFAGEAMEGAEAMRLARQAGVGAVFVGGPALGDRLLVQVGGDWVEGTVYLTAAPAGGEAFAAAYEALAGYPPGPRATMAYEATNFLLGAVARAVDRSGGRPSRAVVWGQLAGGESLGWPAAIFCIEAGGYPGRRLR